MFSSKHEVKYIRAPLIEHARSYLKNDVRTPPQLIILHTGTNDLERTNSPEELISNILILITEASTKFPSSKIFFSTLLPRNDIPTPIITSINDQLVNSCSRLPNVQLIKHDNLFANQLNILHDNKHILKRHIGLFAKNLKDAIHGRLQMPRQSKEHHQINWYLPKVPIQCCGTLHTAMLSKTHYPGLTILKRNLRPYHLPHHNYSNGYPQHHTKLHRIKCSHMLQNRYSNRYLPPHTKVHHMRIPTHCIKRLRMLKKWKLRVKRHHYLRKSYPCYDL